MAMIMVVMIIMMMRMMVAMIMIVNDHGANAPEIETTPTETTMTMTMLSITAHYGCLALYFELHRSAEVARDTMSGGWFVLLIVVAVCFEAPSFPSASAA